jgi:iron-sulfur cluster assembly accessory protein
MIRITEAAKERMIAVLKEDNASLIRCGLQGGGCNGFQYYFMIEQAQEEDDFEYPLDDTFKVIIDATSNMYLENAEIDYKKDLMGESFVFNNPGVKTSCGCGSSVAFD